MTTTALQDRIQLSHAHTLHTAQATAALAARLLAAVVPALDC